MMSNTFNGDPWPGYWTYPQHCSGCRCACSWPQTITTTEIKPVSNEWSLLTDNDVDRIAKRVAEILETK